LRLFFELTLRSFQRHISYRAAALAGFLTNLFFGILRVAVLVALYGARQDVAGISVNGAVTFTGLSQASIGFLGLFGWYELLNNVYTGAVASDLLKPIGFYQLWMAQDLGRALAQFLMRGVSMMVLYAILFDITVPQGIVQWMAFAAALLLAWLVSFSWRFLVNLTAFWVPNALGIARFAFITSWFLSGFLMPLRYFPDWFYQLCQFTPFPHTVNTVIEVYLGVLQGPALLRGLCLQLLWAGLLWAAGQAVLRRGIRRLVILGG
jgi:ABC-2 type transport system permease protein